MKSKKNSIYIANVKGWEHIFIHRGGGPKDSDGCIVIKNTEIEKIYKAIEPKDGKNVTVKIVDMA